MCRLPFAHHAAVLCGLLAITACGDAEAPEVVEEYGAFRGTVVDGQLVELTMLPRAVSVDADDPGAIEHP